MSRQIFFQCALLLVLPITQSIAQPPPPIEGTIVSIRGNLLAIRPTLRPLMTRVTFDKSTVISSYEKTTLIALKQGMNVGMGGTYSDKNGFHPFFIEASDKLSGWLADTKEGLEQKGGG